MKSFTSIEQSRKLAEILPLESADMAYYFMKDDGHLVNPSPFVLDGTEVRENGMFTYLNCWSLAALLNIIPGGQVNRMANSDKWEVSSWNDSDFEPAYYVENYDNPVDACVAMIEKLNELKIL